MRLTTYNIQFGRGLDGKIDLERIARIVDGADVIALQEVERHFIRSGEVDQVAELASHLPQYHWVYGAGVDIDADLRASCSKVSHRRRQFGNMLLSTAPILMSRNHLLPKYASTGPLSIQRCALEGVIACKERHMRVYSIHLTHINAKTRMEQIDEILRIDKEAVMQGGPITGETANTDFAAESHIDALPRESILMGDFNCTADSEEYSLLAGPKSDYGGRVSNPEGFVDAWVAVGNAESSGVTAERRGRPVRMDYCFVRTALQEKIRSATIDADAVGSDHKPFSVVIEI